MSLQVRTKLYAWVLLSVFVPMLLVVSLHHHEDHHAQEVTCLDCVHHVPHAGHLTNAQDAFHDCVLCQWYGQPYLHSEFKVAAPVASVEAQLLMVPCRGMLLRMGYAFPQRGPPVLVLGW
ncbi:MAG: hypothetical protein Q4D56_00485 [Bacteroides sp.]|nr:hypothetical protein [Bacteroides sp.]